MVAHMKESSGSLVKARSDSGPRRRLADKQVKAEVIAHSLVERMADIIGPSGKRAPERTWVLQSTATDLTQLKIQALPSDMV